MRLEGDQTEKGGLTEQSRARKMVLVFYCPYQDSGVANVSSTYGSTTVDNFLGDLHAGQRWLHCSLDAQQFSVGRHNHCPMSRNSPLEDTTTAQCHAILLWKTQPLPNVTHVVSLSATWPFGRNHLCITKETKKCFIFLSFFFFPFL